MVIPSPGDKTQDDRPVSRAILIDVSRLVWRWWRGGLPTGIDRVCLAYVAHFGKHARAVVQRGGHQYIFSAAHSERLFRLFSRGPQGFRSRFVAIATAALLSAAKGSSPRGLLYFNVGHTGLDEAALPQWIEREGLRAIYFVHDLIPLSHPEYCRLGEARKHRRRMENVLVSASGVIANSQATLGELATFATERELSMPAAVASFIAGPPVPAMIEPIVLERPYFIVVGTIEGRKNHILLLRIWERLARKYGLQAPLLVIVGQRGWEAGEALALLDQAGGLKDHIRELGTCTDDQLANFIAGARALLMPSFAEGFGLPVAEALQLGTPVIASDLPVFREFAHDIPTYLDPLDNLVWENAIISFATDCAAREKQLVAMKNFRPPTWQSHFRIVDEWLGAAAKGY